MRDFKNMKRQRGRNRGGPPGGKPTQNVNRAFDSNGPENIKVRGHAQHVYEKYQQLARDASSAGDRVLAENYLQHAEHYFRTIRALQPNRPVTEIVGRETFASGFDIDFEDESVEAAIEAADVAALAAPQPQESGGEGDQNGGGDGGQNRDRWETRNRDRDQGGERPRYENRDRPYRDRDDRPQSGSWAPREGGQGQGGQNTGGQGQAGQGQGDRPRYENRDRPYRDRDDRFRDRDRPQGDRSQGDRVQGDRPQADRAQTDGGRDERPREDRPRYDRDRPRAEGGERAERAERYERRDRDEGEAASEAAPGRMLRSQDGAESHAPAFLQAAAAPPPAADAPAEGEARKPRRRRAAPKAEAGGESSEG
jgi:hypothetical protein